MPPAPDTTWFEYAGSFLAGIMGLRTLQVAKSRYTNGTVAPASEKTLTDVVDAIRAEGTATREVLSDVRSDLRLLLDRESRPKRD